MRHGLLSVVVMGLLASLGQAHFVFVVPDASDAAKAIVVFSDSLEPDEKVSIDKIAQTELFLYRNGTKGEKLETKKDKASLSVVVPGKAAGVIAGVTEYGVLSKKDSKPFRLRYLPKAVLSGAAGQAATIGESVALELVPQVEAGQVRLLLLAKGKPVADTEITVLTPSGKREKIVTDKAGLTSAFEAKGRIGAYVRHSEAQNGEHDGKKYEEVRTYATLVVEFPSK